MHIISPLTSNLLNRMAQRTAEAKTSLATIAADSDISALAITLNILLAIPTAGIFPLAYWMYRMERQCEKKEIAVDFAMNMLSSRVNDVNTTHISKQMTFEVNGELILVYQKQDNGKVYQKRAADTGDGYEVVGFNSLEAYRYAIFLDMMHHYDQYLALYGKENQDNLNNALCNEITHPNSPAYTTLQAMFVTEHEHGVTQIPLGKRRYLVIKKRENNTLEISIKPRVTIKGNIPWQYAKQITVSTPPNIILGDQLIKLESVLDKIGTDSINNDDIRQLNTFFGHIFEANTGRFSAKPRPIAYNPMYQEIVVVRHIKVDPIMQPLDIKQQSSLTPEQKNWLVTMASEIEKNKGTPSADSTRLFVYSYFYHHDPTKQVEESNEEIYQQANENGGVVGGDYSLGTFI